jgi:hypothetical protein
MKATTARVTTKEIRAKEEELTHWLKVNNSHRIGLGMIISTINSNSLKGST